MGDKTKIEWSDATWNPVTGCTRVSAGCDNCYIERTPPFRINHRRFDHTGPGGTTGVQLHPDRLDQPLRWKRPRRVFVNSLSDLFHDDIPDAYIARVFAVMARAPQHTFQVLTKRPGRMRSLVSSRVFTEGSVFDVALRLWQSRGTEAAFHLSWPLPNVWLGVSVEDQKTAELRIPKLLETPAAVRFLSCEPLLGPVNLREVWTGEESYIDLEERREIFTPQHVAVRPRETAGIDWVIVGGESGPRARPMHPDWARSLRDQCTAASVPFFFQQWGEWGPAGSWRGPDHHLTVDGRLFEPGRRLGPDHLSRPVAMHRWGKKAAGRELNGRTWDEYPTTLDKVHA